MCRSRAASLGGGAELPGRSPHLIAEETAQVLIRPELHLAAARQVTQLDLHLRQAQQPGNVTRLELGQHVDITAGGESAVQRGSVQGQARDVIVLAELREHAVVHFDTGPDPHVPEDRVFRKTNTSSLASSQSGASHEPGRRLDQADHYGLRWAAGPDRGYELLMRCIRIGAAKGRARSSARTRGATTRDRAAGAVHRDLQRQAWQWAQDNPCIDGSLPSGRQIASQFGRHERWGRLVKKAGLAGELNTRITVSPG